MNLIEMFKDKLENLFVEETGHQDELAEEQEPFSDDLGVEETGDALEELAVVDGDEVKLAKTVMINLMLL